MFERKNKGKREQPQVESLRQVQKEKLKGRCALLLIEELRRCERKIRGKRAQPQIKILRRV
jgi:hypothetical protein